VQTINKAFDCIQNLIERELISAGHDRSDGGLITTILEMLFAGNCGGTIVLDEKYMGKDAMLFLFNEELGIVLEVQKSNLQEVEREFIDAGIHPIPLGYTCKEKIVTISMVDSNKNERVLLREDVTKLRNIWNETSYNIERIQSNPVTADQVIILPLFRSHV
jgi:phosphoribosylformylglycinamidine synthase